MQQFDFGALLDAMPDAVLVADMDSRIVYANPSVERVLGWEPGKLVGEHLHAIQPERLHAAHDAAFARFATTGEKRRFDAPIRLPACGADGEERDVELNLAEIRGPSGERLVVGVIRDLAERVELERHLTVLRYLRATTAAAARLWTRLDPTLVLQTLTDALVADFDSALARAWIYEPDTESLLLMASSGLSTRVAESSRARIDVSTYPYKVGVVARTRRPFVKNGLAGDPEFDQEWVAREGLQAVVCLPLMTASTLLGVMVHFTREPISDEVAETIANLAALAAAALNDARLVTQEREARSEADRGRRHFELVAHVSERLAASLDPEVTVQSVADAVVPAFADWCVVDLLDDDRSLQTVASAHRDPALTGLIGELRSHYPPQERTDPPHAIYRAIDSGRTVCEEVSRDALRQRAVDDRHLSLLQRLGIGSHIVAVLATRGRIIGAVSLVRRREGDPFTEDDVLTAEDIARRSAMATDNARLYRSAQQAIELRDRFLAVASHELRTPLSVVYGHWELLARWLRADAGAGAAAPRNAEKVELSVRRLGQGVDQLRRLVEELLDVSRLTRGYMDLRLSEVDLGAVVREAIDDAAESAGGRRIATHVPAEPVIGRWDAGRLRQVVDNLLLNALKYSSADSAVTVEVLPEGDRATLRVTDEGIGIPPAELETIFQPFSRAENASAQHYPGLGLGLAVSREIVSRLGGRMWAESAGEGRGSSFFVELPLGHPSGPPTEAVSESDGADGDLRRDTRRG